MTAWIFSSLFAVCLVGMTTGQSTCSRSHDCTGAGQCCRDSQRDVNLVNDPQGPFESILGGGHGQCVDGGARAGDMCDSQCQCPSGYECYRKITGACCAPRTCITQAQANADRDYWNCLGMMPPAAHAPDQPQSAARRSLFRSLCPHQMPMGAMPQVPGVAVP